ncbi:hypothetical protein [Glycomyces buryatensis]|uniref:Uncharacterized protein n=1 Tax=Glycomyces buryatensis TaxID=2570927 RepID=A0A4S8QGU5_9ACTN|nr:hypothetical protein [Glycomyces buryatensis]THV42402.1 hypothetical protein FAB82_07045 [Glycomyces buryatensis]
MADPTSKPPTAPKSGPDRARREFRVTVWVVVVSLVLTCTAFIWRHQYESDFSRIAEETVTSYFEALQDKDIQSALALTDYVPDPSHPEYLDPEVIGEDWSVGRVETVGTSEAAELPMGVTAEATVDVDLDFDGQTETGQFTVREGANGPYIMDPATNMFILEAGVSRDFVQVNGLAITGSTVELTVLPGVYDFGAEAGRVALFPGDDPPADATATPPLNPGDFAEVAHNTATNVIEDCATQSVPEPIVGTASAWDSCPFGIDQLELDLFMMGLWDPFDVEWTVIEYPEWRLEVDANGVLVANSIAPLRMEVSGHAFYRDEPEGEKYRHAFHLACDFPDLIAYPVVHAEAPEVSHPNGISGPTIHEGCEVLP